MGEVSSSGLSRRERQIMDLIYAREQATAAEVRQAMSDAPSYSAVRALLRILEQKGHLRHVSEEGKYVYTPVRRRSHAGRGALRGILRTFFDNSAAKAVAALLDVSDAKLSETELGEISELIAKAKKRGPKP
jgi:BlaI family transcriptional regulator, penicillinase repressor